MDEEDGKPGARSRQLGPLSALSGVALQSLFQSSSTPTFCFPRNSTASPIPAGAKAQNFNGRFFGTTKVVPFHKTAEFTPILNTIEVVPFHELALTTMLRSNTP
jgi:hypothetical protein